MAMSEFRRGNPAEILLVEDNPGDIRLTKEAFKDGQIANSLHVVTDGIEALDFLYQRGDHTDAPRPDIILLDLDLPRKDGHEVLEELKGDSDHRRIPIIILTSSDAHEDMIRSYDGYANAYLTKPVDSESFTETARTFERFWLSIVRLSGKDKEVGPVGGRSSEE